MIGFSGVWDARMKHQTVCFGLTMFFVLLGYFAATSSGLIPAIRFLM
ncbi:MAG: hypothetical protein LCI00_33200 [Chloroflexi bacterium]|nr:hypothetical protein [Chloroflexota bacterium]MCC6896536.1 hypothetical protein [Anaerolineae bacterium]